jgi:hypothetical protein
MARENAVGFTWPEQDGWQWLHTFDMSITMPWEGAKAPKWQSRSQGLQKWMIARALWMTIFDCDYKAQLTVFWL